MKIQKIALREAKGLKYNIDLDLSDKDGIIGIIGSNGVGKSTLEWQMLPYTSDILKGWKLKDRFQKSGAKQVIYEIGNKTHEINIAFNKGDPICSYKIDGVEQNESLKQSLFEDVVENKFMPLNMATHSIYSVEATAIGRGKAGKLTTSLALLDPKDRKQYFISLFGLDKYDEYKDKAKQKKDELEAELQKLDSELANINGALSVLNVEEDVESIKSRIKELPELIKKYETAQKAYNEYMKYVHDRQEYENLKKMYLEKFNADSVEHLMDYVQQLREKYAQLKARSESVKEYNDLKSKIERLERDYELARNRSEALMKIMELKNKGSISKETYRELDSKKQLLSEKINAMEDAEKARTAVQESIVNLPCDEETRNACKLHTWAKGLISGAQAAEIKVLKAEESELLMQLKEKHELMMKYASELKSLCAQYNIDMNAIDSELDKESKNMASLESEINYTRERIIALEAYRNMDADIKDTSDRINTIESAINRLNNAKIKEVEPAEQPEYNPTDLAMELSRLQTTLKRHEESQEKMKELNAKKSEIEAKVQNIEKDIEDYSFLMSAFDKNGIVAFELEQLCPIMTEKVNALLKDTEYEVDIRTYEYKNKGTAKEKIKEVFDIIVYVSGEPRIYSELSAGQRVLPDLALSQAASMILSQEYSMETILIDERDGSLSVNNKLPFVDMLRKAHQISGRKNTFIISHDPTIWTTCDWVIYMNDNDYIIDRPENINLEI